MTDTTQHTSQTHFAPAGRASREELEKWRRMAEESPLFRAVQESVDGYLMILNPQRQVLAVNRQLVRELGVASAECLVGSRPGELLGCIHALSGPDGCGTSLPCSTCGAVLSILDCQRQDQPVVGECLATVRRGGHTEALELRVRATPVRVGSYDFTVLVFHDVSQEKRRLVLERVFFHDVLNTINSLLGWSQHLQECSSLDVHEIAGRIAALSQRLSREVQDQRRLVEAEQGCLELTLERVRVNSLFELLQVVLSGLSCSEAKTLHCAQAGCEEEVSTDVSLLVRVLTNMAKNAMEASAPGETVRVWHERRNGHPVFLVHNRAVIPAQTAMRIFQRSFTTKGELGRGLGTYSMKLFGERYLGGQVAFETSPEHGTTFSITLPPG